MSRALLSALAVLALHAHVAPVHVHAHRCERAPDGHVGGRTPADGRFALKVSGAGDSYVPGSVYTVTLASQRSAQMTPKFIGFLLVAETESHDVPGDPLGTPATGTFQTLGDSLTKYSERCPNAVQHASSTPKSEITALWTAPPPGSGCISIKATVIEHHDIWYMDEGPLTKVLCENVQESFDMQPPVVKTCCACNEAKYEVTFEGLWSRHTHPKDFPQNGWLTRFSDVIGASHAADYSFWDYGSHASEGLRQLAEHGATRVLESELKAESNHIRTIIKARGISYPNLTGKTFAVFRVDSRHHLMSLVSMISPSPDWIVGVSGLELCTPNCSWIESKKLNLYPWDVGTDSGPTYVSPDQPTTPRDVIRRIRPNFPNDPRSPFYDPSGNEMKPLARLYLSRQRLYEKVCEGGMAAGSDEDSADLNPCQTTSWSPWSACSVTCGTGVKRRQRHYRHGPEARAAGCTKRLSTRTPCTGARKHCSKEAEMNPECRVSEWSDWTTCTATCGKGRKLRTRQRLTDMDDIQDMYRNYKKSQHRRAIKGSNERGDDGDEEGSEEAEEQEVDPNDPCVNVPMNEEVECEGELPSCDITEEEARHQDRLFTNLNIGNQMGSKPKSGPIPPSKITGDGSLSGYDGPTPKPADFDFDEENYKNYRRRIANNNGRHGSYRDKNNNNQQYPHASGMKSNYYDYYKGQIQTPTYNSEEDDASYEGDEEEMRRTEYDRMSRRPNYPGTGGVIEEPVGQIKNCKVSPWSEWSECGQTCGTSFRNKSRYIIQHPMNGGRSCPKKLLRRKKCKNQPPCHSGRDPEDNDMDSNYDSTNPTWGPGNSISNNRVDCLLSRWSAWSPCSASCGSSGVRQRTRAILRPASGGGAPCSARLDKQACDLMPCPL